MKIKVDTKLIIQVVCVLLLILFFVPMWEVTVNNNRSANFSAYTYAMGKNIEIGYNSIKIKPHSYTWILTIAPIALLALTFIKIKQIKILFPSICGVALLLIWVISSDYKLMFTGIIYIMVYTALGVAMPIYEKMKSVSTEIIKEIKKDETTEKKAKDK